MIIDAQTKKPIYLYCSLIITPSLLTRWSVLQSEIFSDTQSPESAWKGIPEAVSNEPRCE